MCAKTFMPMLVLLILLSIPIGAYGAGLAFSKGNVITYGNTDIITATPSNALNITEISINNIVVANTLTANTASTFDFEAYGTIHYLNSNVIAGNSYAINAISTNSVNLVPLGSAQGSIGYIVSNTISVTTASPPLNISVPLDKMTFAYGTFTQFNQIPVSLYVNNALVSNTITGIHNSTISGIYSPYGVAFSPNGAYAYVTNFFSDEVNIINTSTAKTTTSAVSGVNVPSSVAFSPNGAYAYVTNNGNNTISIVNTSTKTIVSTISGFDEPYGVAFYPDGAYAYVTNYGKNDVSIVNTSTKTIVSTISGFDEPYGVAFSLSGAYAYVTNERNGTISIVNTSTSSIISTISGFDYPDGVAFSPNGAYAYVAAGGNISIVNTYTKTIASTISGFHDPVGVAFSPNRAYAYVTNNGNSTVSVINTEFNSYKFSAAGTYSLTANTLGNSNYTSNTISLTFNVINESITINLSATSNTSYTYNTKAPSIIASLKSNSISGNVLNSLAFNFNSGTGNIITYNNGNSLKVQMPSNSSFATAGNYLYIISSKMQNDFLNSTNTIIVYNDIIPNSIKISILKAAPAVLLKTPRNTVYNGSSVLTYYGTFTQFNQIPVRLYANNAIVSNTVIGILNSTVSGNFDFPLGIAISPNGAYAYVVNNGNSNISVINTSTSKVVRTISGFNYSDGVAFSPNGAYAYVSSDAYLYVNSETALLQSDNLSIVNTSTGSRIGTIAGFNEPLSVAIAPSGAYAYVMNNQNNTISIVNTSTRSIIGTISGFSFPYGMAISSNGTNAYVSNYGVSQVWLINGLTHSGYEPIISIISSFPFAAGLEGVAFLPTDSYIYVAGINYNKIAIINTSTNEVVSTIPISSPAYIAVSPSGAYAYVTDPTDNYISIINTGFGSYKLSAAGTYSLTANTPGNVNYTSNTASASFTIAKATPTLQLNVCSNYTYSGSAGCLITASINSFGNQLKGYLYINGNVVANSTSTSNTITFTAHEGAGNYSVVFNTTGNRNYTSNSIKKDFTIAKASPSITFPVFPQNFVYNGSTATVEAEISTYNNQLQANAFVNNALVSSFYSSNDFAVGPAAGNYTITANTLGNGNYTPISVSRIFTIIPAPVHSSSSTSSLYITDNVNKTYASNRSVFDVYLINYSDNAKVLNITYYQNQLPAEISFPAHYYVRFNFACAFTANGNYYVSNNTYGLLDSVPCGTNYTTTGGSYSAYYLKMIIPTTTTTTTTTTTVTTTTLPSISITNKGYEVSLNIAPHERSKITITQLHIALNIYSNYTKNITEDVTIKNVTSTMPSVPISYHTISGFNISATPKVPAINTTVTYACSLNPSQIKPLMFVNGTWMPVTDYSINQSACSIAFFASAPAVVAVATTQNITTTIPATTATTTILPVAKPTPNYEEYAIIVVIVVLAIIIIAYAAMKATAKGSR